MEVSKLDRQQLSYEERNNETTGRSRTREVRSRYRSPSPSAASGPRRYPSPSINRTGTASSARRAVSAERRQPSTPPSVERRRPSTPPSPPSPSTPVHDTLASRKTISNRMPEALWPSTMRSLSVSFRSDTFSHPISKREKPVTSNALSDRTLKQTSNVAHKQAVTPPASRKPTPERKRSPLKGKNAPEQSENSKPVDGLHGQPVDHHRWPSRTGGRVSSNALAKSVDLADRTTKTATHPGMAATSLRRISLPGSLSKPLQKSASDAVRRLSLDGSGNVEAEAGAVDDGTLKISKLVSSRPPEATSFRRMSLPGSFSRPLQKSASNAMRRLSLDGSGKEEAEAGAVDDSTVRIAKLVSPRPSEATSTRRMSLPGSLSRPLQKSASDVVRQLSFDGSGKVDAEAGAVDDSKLRIAKLVSPRPSEPTCLRRLSLPGSLSKPLQKTASDAVRRLSLDGSGEVEAEARAERTKLLIPLSQAQSLPSPGSRPPSSNKTSLPGPGPRPPSPNTAFLLTSSISRGVNPSRTKNSNPAPSRGVSPSRIRSSSPSRQSSSSTSVLSFIADIGKGKQVADHIEDVHQLRLLYNRHLQWRYTNARADVALYSQKVTTETTLYNVWRTTLEQWNSLIEKRINLQQLRMKLKLYSLLNEEVPYLDGWALVERDHTCALSGAIKDLQESTLHLPVTGRARADIETVKAAVCSAVNVMQTTGSSIESIFSRVEGMNCMVSELADVAAQERAMLDECEALLEMSAAMQVEEYSLMTHFVQLKQTRKSDEQSILPSSWPLSQ